MHENEEHITSAEIWFSEKVYLHESRLTNVHVFVVSG